MSLQEATQPRSLYRMTIVERLPAVGLVHHVDAQNTVWATKKRNILCRRDGAWQRLASFPFSSPRDFFGWNRLASRAARADQCNVFVNSKGRVLGIRANRVYSLEESGELCELFAIAGDCVLRRGICEDPQGWTYFGEYSRNTQRAPVRIWRLSPDLDSYELAHEFPSGSIRHVHCVLRDPYDDAIWVTVGDFKNECYLLRTDNRFQSLERFGDGTQIWRAVVLYFTADHVCWLTDSHLEQNYACRMDRRRGELEIGAKIPCSGWYGSTTTEGLHVGFTTVERGPGIQRNESSIFVSEDAFHWQEVGSFRKDIWRPVRLFKFGVISCPSGAVTSRDFFISGEGLAGLDGVAMRLRFDRRDCQP